MDLSPYDVTPETNGPEDLGEKDLDSKFYQRTKTAQLDRFLRNLKISASHLENYVAEIQSIIQDYEKGNLTPDSALGGIQQSMVWGHSNSFNPLLSAQNALTDLRQIEAMEFKDSVQRAKNQLVERLG